MGVGEDFQNFCSLLTVNNTADISVRYCRITRRCNLEYWNTESDTAHSFYTGSYGRGTARRGFSDLDMIVELPWSLYTQYNGYVTNGQSALLQDVKRSIQKSYPDTDVGGDGQVVVAKFSDGMRFEVVPGFRNDDGSYTYPDANGGGTWRTTNPKPEIAAIATRNGTTNGNLIELCRMAREWKAMWSVPMGGLHVDTLAYAFIENWAHRDKSYLYYDYMARDFFKYVKDQDPKQDWWRAPGSGQWVHRRGDFEYRALRCYNIALDAITLYGEQKVWTARQRWREIFGTSFPAE
jgi:hypothetical protein